MVVVCDKPNAIKVYCLLTVELDLRMKIGVNLNPSSCFFFGSPHLTCLFHFTCYPFFLVGFKSISQFVYLDFILLHGDHTRARLCLRSRLLAAKLAIELALARLERNPEDPTWQTRSNIAGAAAGLLLAAAACWRRGGLEWRLPKTLLPANLNKVI